MENNKELENPELENISGGNKKLDDYFKKIDGTVKNKMLVDYGTGVSLDLNPSVDYDKNDNVLIIKREKPDAELPTSDLILEK